MPKPVALQQCNMPLDFQHPEALNCVSLHMHPSLPMSIHGLLVHYLQSTSTQVTLEASKFHLRAATTCCDIPRA